MKKVIIYLSFVFAFSFILNENSSAQVMLQRAVISNGGGVATNGTTRGMFVVGQTATGVASNAQTTGHFGFFNTPGVASSVNTQSAGAISSLKLSPNPASNEVSININLANAANIDLMLYDASGHLVSTVFSGRKEAGITVQKFDVSTLPSGAYFVAARIPGALVQSKLEVVK